MFPHISRVKITQINRSILRGNALNGGMACTYRNGWPLIRVGGGYMAWNGAVLKPLSAGADNKMCTVINETSTYILASNLHSLFEHL